MLIFAILVRLNAKDTPLYCLSNQLYYADNKGRCLKAGIQSQVFRVKGEKSILFYIIKPFIWLLFFCPKITYSEQYSIVYLHVLSENQTSFFS